MSTYYEYREVKVKIAHRLMKMDGWNVYGYHADQSDSMTDYYDPAYWGGIATKNGYTLVIDHQSETKDYTETRTRYTNGINTETRAKIKKLEAMTQERGASEQEEATAKAKIQALREKEEEGREEYTIFYPGHKANPPRCNWHIEKDGIIVDKGTGLLKFSSVPDISGLGYPWEIEHWQQFNNLSREQWIENEKTELMARNDEERAQKYAESRYNDAKETYSLLEKFNVLISRFNSVCGGMMGDADKTYTFEEVTVTEYKKEIKPKETATGEFKDGQCFIIKSDFNYGIRKGYVYRICATQYDDGKTSYIAYRMNGKNTKMCTGSANTANRWYIGTQPNPRMKKWFERGDIAWCDLVEVKTPYEVKKVVKKYNESCTDKTTEATQDKTESKQANNTAETPENATQGDCDATHEDSVINTAENATQGDFEGYTADSSDSVCNDGEINPNIGFSNFEELAKAFCTGKQVNKAENKKEHIQEETKDTGETEKEAATATDTGTDTNTDTDTTPTPQEPLYNERFTRTEIASMISGDRVTYNVENYTVHYIATRSDINNAIWYVYSQENYHSMNLKTGQYGGFKWYGFIYNGYVYSDIKKINNALREAVELKIKETYPDVNSILENCDLSDWQLKDIQEYKHYTFNNTVLEYFYKDEDPEPHYTNDHNYDDNINNAIGFITEPGKCVLELANNEVKNHGQYIAKAYIQRDNVLKALKELREDTGRIEHKAKAILNSMGDEKTYTIKTYSGNKYKVSSYALRSIGRNLSISEYEFHDRDSELPISEIMEITHGRRTLYKCS